jgi:hypothetical protein
MEYARMNLPVGLLILVMIIRMLGAIRQLQVEVALAGPPTPAKREPEAQHHQWAKELLGQA